MILLIGEQVRMAHSCSFWGFTNATFEATILQTVTSHPFSNHLQSGQLFWIANYVWMTTVDIAVYFNVHGAQGVALLNVRDLDQCQGRFHDFSVNYPQCPHGIALDNQKLCIPPPTRDPHPINMFKPLDSRRVANTAPASRKSAKCANR